MSPHKYCLFALGIFLSSLFPQKSYAVTLTSGQTDYSTTSDITTSGVGISSSLVGTSDSLDKITNLHVITTGNSGGTSSAYGIKTTGNYNKITNSSGASIFTTGSSGRGISIGDFSEVYNVGSITTAGTTSYGIYGGGDNNTISNSGSITTSNTTSYGIYLNGNNSSAANSGTINTQVYGIYGVGNVNQISNSGTITTTVGSSAYGIYVSAASASTATSSSYNTINNSGTINSNSHGIYNKDNYTQITNSGTITPASSSGIYAIRNDGDNVVITNSGTITATNYAIYNSGSSVTINSSGTVNGAILIGSGTLNIFGGSISGSVDGATNTGSVEIGSSSVATSFSQTSSFLDLASLKINSGSTLNSSASISASSIILDENATLNLNSGFSVTGSITGVSSSSGILNISGTSFAPTTSLGSSGNKLDNLNINSGGSFSVSNNIYVTDILVSDGDLNIDGTDGLTIFGNLAGSGAGQINLGSNSQTVSGNFTLTAGDNLAVTLGNNAVGNLTVSGVTNIDSNSKLAITTSENQGYITSGSSFTIINAASGSTINAIADSNISINGLSSNKNGLLTFTTQATSDSLILSVNRLEAAQVTDNKNSQNIYQNINSIGGSATGLLAQFQTYLDNSNLSSSEITETINQLAPQPSKAALASNINIIGNSVKMVESRLDKSNQNFGQNSGDDLEGVEGIWMQAFGSSATQNSVKNDDGYKMNSSGFVLAADQKTDDEITVGVALSYAKSRIKSSDNSKTNLVNTYQANIYGGWNFDEYFLDTVGLIALNQYQSNRSIDLVNAEAIASYGGQTYGAKIKGGSVNKLSDNLNLTPEISVNFLHSNIDGYQEKDAGTLNLNVRSVSANFLETRAGLNLGWISKLPEFPEFDKIATNFKISYGYSIINDAPTTVSNFEGQSTTFNSQISQIDRSSLRLETEVVAYHMDDMSFSADYSFEKKKTYQSHFISLKVRQDF